MATLPSCANTSLIMPAFSKSVPVALFAPFGWSFESASTCNCSLYAPLEPVSAVNTSSWFFPTDTHIPILGAYARSICAPPSYWYTFTALQESAQSVPDQTVVFEEVYLNATFYLVALNASTFAAAPFNASFSLSTLPPDHVTMLAEIPPSAAFTFLNSSSSSSSSTQSLRIALPSRITLSVPGRYRLALVNASGSLLAASCPFGVYTPTTSLAVAKLPTPVSDYLPRNAIFRPRTLYTCVLNGTNLSNEPIVFRAKSQQSVISITGFLHPFPNASSSSSSSGDPSTTVSFIFGFPSSGVWKVEICANPHNPFAVPSISFTMEVVPATIELGALFDRAPSFVSIYADIELSSLLASVLANTNKSLFPILPYTNISLNRRDTDCFDAAVAVESIISLVQFNRIQGIIGPFCSLEATTAATIGAAYTIPTMSYAASDSLLSDKRIYPYFLRVFGGISLQARVFAETVRYFNWTIVSLLQMNTLRLDDELRVRLQYYKVQIAGDIEMTSSAADMYAKLLLLKQQKIYVIVFGGIVGVDIGKVFLDTVISLRMCAPQYTWIFPTTFRGLFDSLVVSYPYLFKEFTGSLFLGPYTVYNSTILRESVKLRLSHPSTYWGPEFETATVANESYFLANGFGAVADIAFETTLAYAHAIHNVIHVRKQDPTGINIRDALFALDFEGLMGRIFFDANGDRQNTLAANQLKTVGNSSYFALAFYVSWTKAGVPSVTSVFQNPDSHGVAGLAWANGVVSPFAQDRPAEFNCTTPCINGTCIGPDRCVCSNGFKTDTSTGLACSQPICGWSFGPACSVYGTCTSPGLCTCFKGYTGPDCSERIVNIIHRTSSKSAAILAVTIILIIFTVLLFLMIVLSPAGRTRILRSANPMFLIFMLVGSFLAYISIILGYPDPQTTGLCIMKTWLAHLGFTLAYGSLFVKSWRVARIFNAKLMADMRKIENSTLLGILICIICIAVLFLALWTAFSPPVIELVVDPETFMAIYRCQSSPWEYTLFVAELVLLLWGCVIAYQVRKAPAGFNEAKFLGLSIYNWVLAGALVKAISFSMTRPTGDTLFILDATYVMSTFFVMQAFIFIPKIYLIAKGKGDNVLTSSGVYVRPPASQGADNERNGISNNVNNGHAISNSNSNNNKSAAARNIANNYIIGPGLLVSDDFGRAPFSGPDSGKARAGVNNEMINFFSRPYLTGDANVPTDEGNASNASNASNAVSVNVSPVNSVMSSPALGRRRAEGQAQEQEPSKTAPEGPAAESDPVQLETHISHVQTQIQTLELQLASLLLLRRRKPASSSASPLSASPPVSPMHSAIIRSHTVSAVNSPGRQSPSRFRKPQAARSSEVMSLTDHMVLDQSNSNEDDESDSMNDLHSWVPSSRV